MLKELKKNGFSL